MLGLSQVICFLLLLLLIFPDNELEQKQRPSYFSYFSSNFVIAPRKEFLGFGFYFPSLSVILCLRGDGYS